MCHTNYHLGCLPEHCTKVYIVVDCSLVSPGMCDVKTVVPGFDPDNA